MIDLLQTIDSTLTGMTGSLTLVFTMILVFFLIGFLLAGLDFKFALLMIFPLVAWFTDKQISVLNPVIGAVFWIVVIGLGIFLLWNVIQEKVYV